MLVCSQFRWYFSLPRFFLMAGEFLFAGLIIVCENCFKSWLTFIVARLYLRWWSGVIWEEERKNSFRFFLFLFFNSVCLILNGYRKFLAHRRLRPWCITNSSWGRGGVVIGRKWNCLFVISHHEEDECFLSSDLGLHQCLYSKAMIRYLICHPGEYRASPGLRKSMWILVAELLVFLESHHTLS